MGGGVYQRVCMFGWDVLVVEGGSHINKRFACLGRGGDGHMKGFACLGRMVR